MDLVTPEELGDRTRELLIDPEKALYVSPVSTLEIARLTAKGTIRLSGGFLEWVNDTLEALSGITGFRMKLPLRLTLFPDPFTKIPPIES